MDKWRQMCDILVVDRAAFLSQLIEYHARANRIPEDDHIGDQAQRAKLILVPVAVASLTQLPAPTVKHFTSQAVVPLATSVGPEEAPRAMTQRSESLRPHKRLGWFVTLNQLRNIGDGIVNNLSLPDRLENWRWISADNGWRFAFAWSGRSGFRV